MAYAKLKDINPCYQTFGVVQQPIICDPIFRGSEPISTEGLWSTESYEPRVTLPYNEWRQYVASGSNTLYAGTVIPGSTFAGTVYRGHVHQGY
jgi:hypothetical protein